MLHICLYPTPISVLATFEAEIGVTFRILNSFIFTIHISCKDDMEVKFVNYFTERSKTKTTVLCTLKVHLTLVSLPSFNVYSY